MSTIGTLHESPLHAALKTYYARPGAAVEVARHGYIIDVVDDDYWIEIQTGHVAQIKRKLACLVEQHPVRLVLPVTLEKWLVRVGPDGATVLGRRKSPQRGAVEWIFRELVSIPHLLAHPSFTLVAPLIQEEVVRRHDPARNWRRHGWGTVERRLLAVVAERVFTKPADLAGLLPLTLAEPFTARELAAALGHPVGLAHQMIYCLRAMDALTPTGKAGRALTYRRVNTTA